MKTKVVVLGFIAVTAGVFAWTRPHNGAPQDLRDAPGAIEQLTTGLEGQVIEYPKPTTGLEGQVIEYPKPTKGYVAGNDPSAGAPAKQLEWVAIKTFEMSKTAVTVGQYAECVIAEGCTEPNTGHYCNWGKPDRQLHPVNCVDWDQAQAYAKFKGARLPSEAEFEYAATSGGRNQKYPWGNNEPNSKLAVFNADSTMPVCSKPKGNTAHGLCDMSGNVWQWVQDGRTHDGSVVEGAGARRVARGGSFIDADGRFLRVDYPIDFDPGYRSGLIGFRLVR